MTAPTADQYAKSLARCIRDRLLADEKPVADLVLADFNDMLNAAADAAEQIVICRDWQRWINDLRRQRIE